MKFDKPNDKTLKKLDTDFLCVSMWHTSKFVFLNSFSHNDHLSITIFILINAPSLIKPYIFLWENGG